MKRASRLLAAIVFWLCIPAAPIRAGILDQAFEPTIEDDFSIVVSPFQTLAQTFRVRRTFGVLDRVDVYVARNALDLPPEGLLLEIRTTAADGSPTDTVLASVLIPSDDVPLATNFTGPFDFIGVDLSTFGLEVHRNDVLAIVLSTENAGLGTGGVDPYAWSGDFSTPYRRGDAYINSLVAGEGFGIVPDADFGFRTFVEPPAPVPEPSSLVLLMAGACSVLGRRFWPQRMSKPL